MAEMVSQKNGFLSSNLLNVVKILFLLSGIILLPILTSFYFPYQINRPEILLVGVSFVFFYSKNLTVLTIQKFILIYIALMFFNQLALNFVNIGDFSINTALIVLVPLAISYSLMQLIRSVDPISGKKDVLFGWFSSFAIIILHMLILFPLLHYFYGFGYENNFGVLANLCLYFMGFVFLWNQLDNLFTSKIIATIFAVFFVTVIWRGAS